MTSPANGANGAACILPLLRAYSAVFFWQGLGSQGYYVGRAEAGTWTGSAMVLYQSAFLTTSDGVVLFDAPPSIGGNLRRAVDEIAAANGVSNTGDAFRVLPPSRRSWRGVRRCSTGTWSASGMRRPGDC